MKTSSQPSLSPNLLTPRQKQIITLLEQGLLQREVGDALSISTKTVETQLYRLKKKFYCHSICQLGFLIKTMMLSAH